MSMYAREMDDDLERELLARLLAIAAALGVEPGAVLARLEAP